ncbi:hypothetical protein K2173_018634 [Erythroxylum novogranatense]|uniref:PORR domain-containing protein n=1 Tax=Erythroxylum novogranatense TaxID=1862640 RepID=A0AAV8SAU7_9ROSI|nr:hypothetical protein K2173_018634 [Erythroxylum novogranatense]
MDLCVSYPYPKDCCFFLNSSFLASIPGKDPVTCRKPRNNSISITCSSPKTVPSPSLDRHVVKQNRTRFVQKLKTLLLSKPKHYIPLQILSKCRSYLSLADKRSVRSMIHRYPSIFDLFTIPLPPTPINSIAPFSHQLCVRLTPAASALAAQELELFSAMTLNLANKLRKLLMLASHHRLLLSKLVHLAPDLGLPPNFRSRLCNDHPDKFKTVDTSYGRALELVSWDPNLAVPMSPPDVSSDLIVDRPLKFKRLRLRKGLNVRRQHREYLIKFGELPDVCPYNTSMDDLEKESIEAEKRACAVVREVLGMTVEMRTLIDHLTHFRKEFGFPNKFRGMILRHPELFYVSLKGVRNSVFLVEGYDDKGRLLKRPETSVIKDKLMELILESKRMRRDRRRSRMNGNNVMDSIDDCIEESDHTDDEYDDGFEDIFESDDPGLDYALNIINSDCNEIEGLDPNRDLWVSDTPTHTSEDAGYREPW